MPKLKIRILFGLCIFLLSGVDAWAQTSYANQNWYFGNSIYGIRFNRPNQTPALDDTHMTIPFGRFGNATANEPETGNLLFYTDGQQVYDGSFSLMVNGTGLDADVTKNQNTAIASVPGDNDSYFIFTNTVGGDLHVSLVDMTNVGNAVFPQPPLGSVSAPINNVITNSSGNASGAMLLVSKADLTGYYLITSDNDPTNATYYIIDIDGPDPALWNETSIDLGSPITAAHLTYSESTNKIAVAPQSQNTNVQILDIDITAGTLSFDTEITNSGNADFLGEAVYDTEWSPDGSKLYISRYGGNANIGDLLQWDSNALPGASLLSVLPNRVFGSYGLKLGPDNNVYHLYQPTGIGPYLVGQIIDSDSIASLTSYATSVFATEDFNGLQFPSTLPPRQLDITLDFTFAGICANTATSFYPEIDPPADTVFWDFGDGSNSPLLAPIYTYQGGGTYNVRMTARLNGQDTSVVKQVMITDFDLQLTLPSDTVACQCELPKYGMPTPCTQFSVTVQPQSQSGIMPTYLWSNGDTDATLEPDSAGYYYVVATDPLSGCSTYAGVNVQEYGFQDQRANIWYFGNQAGIDFNPPATNALGDGIMDAPEGCTAISDRNGQILFYTDGNDVFIKDRITAVHQLVETGIGGSPNSTQSVIAMPFPNDETLFYIFTTEEVGTGTNNYAFKYSVFDIKANGGQGDIIEKDITLFTKSTERIAATANWVVIHEYGNNNFRAYQITPTGISTPVVSSLGSDHFTTSSPEQTAQGYMKISGDKLAVALSETPTGPSFIEVFDWDDAIGQVTDFETIDIAADGAVNALVYGLDFSPGGNKLYATVQINGGSSLLMEYRADSLNKINHINNIPEGQTLGAIQTAPDGQLYVAVDGSSSLGIIAVNEDTISNSTFNVNGFALAGGTNSRLGLPNYASSFGSAMTLPGILVSTPVCVGQDIYLAASTTSIIDTVYWQIADPSGQIVFTSQAFADTTNLLNPGNYLVSLLMGNRCGLDTTFSETITVSPPPQTSSLPAGLPICGPSTVLDPYDIDPPDVAEYDFLWSTGETTRTIIVASQGPYTVTMTNRNSGCTNMASVFVGPPFPVDLGPDLTNCESDPLILDSQANASTYTWLIDGVAVAPVNNQRTFDFGALGLPGGVYTVGVEVVDPVDPTCIILDEAIITINPQPAFSIPIVTPTTCGNSIGVIDFTITNAGTGSFTYDIVGPTTNLLGQPLVAGSASIPNLEAGSFLITVYNALSGCSARTTIIIINSNPLFTVPTLTPSPDGCDPSSPSGNIFVEISDPSVLPFEYDVRDQISNTIVISGTAIDAGGGTFNIPNVPSGDYIIELDSGPGGCLVIETTTVAPTQISDLQVNNTISGCNTIDLNPFVSSSTGAFIEWSYDDVLYNGLATLIDPVTDGTNFGTFDIYIRATDPALILCDTTRIIPVTLVPTPTATISADNSQICEGFVTLSAIVDGGYPGAQLEYRWLPNGETTPSITATQDGVNYSVSVNNVLNQSCFVTDNTLVSIPQPFTVSVSSTLACDDDQPFTLTATATNANVNYTWTLNGNDIPGNAILTTTQAGLYEVTATDVINPGNCSSMASLNVIKAPVTPTNLSSTQVFCPDEGEITLDAGPGFTDYLWDTGETTQTIMVTAGGTYRIQATNNFGCITDDQSEVLEDCIPKIFGPNAFRPGGLNSEFYLFNQYIDLFDIFIYSRWGELLYHSDNKDFRWDGTYEGQLMPAGQYTWVVRYTSSFRDRGTLEQYGGVTLLR